MPKKSKKSKKTQAFPSYSFPPRLVVMPAGQEQVSQAQYLCQTLKVPWTETFSELFDFVLKVTPEGLKLYEVAQKRQDPVFIDFHHHSFKYRQRPQHPQELLVRALGFSPKVPLTLFDATAGFLTESILLLSLGISITARERSPLIALLVQDALERGMQQCTLFKERVLKQLSFAQGESSLALQQLETPPDVIYLDPMFPERQNRSAQNKKEMRILRYFVGEDQDIESLFTLARSLARQRVVVKRPQYAPPLGETPPHFSYQGKQIRFDIYLASSSKPFSATLRNSETNSG
jgi:16S rRNA (guanine1516-N2)-methyltransferase